MNIGEDVKYIVVCCDVQHANYPTQFFGPFSSYDSAQKWIDTIHCPFLHYIDIYNLANSLDVALTAIEKKEI